MENRPRGRAALRESLLAAMRRPGEETATPQNPAPEVPKPRGRAELLNKLRNLAKAAAPGPAPAAAPVPSPAAGDAPQLTQAVQELQIKEPEPIKKMEKNKTGAVIPVYANYVHLHRDAAKGYHRYEVKFSPDVDSKPARKRLIYAIVSDLGGVHIFNGMNDLYLPHKLHEPRRTFESVHPFDPETTVEITVIYKRLEPWGSQDAIHFINVLFKRIMNILQLIQIKRNYFNLALKTRIPQYDLEVIPGYAVAVDDMEGGLMICLDSCHKLLRNKSVLDLLMQLQRTFPGESFKDKAMSELLGQTVLTTHNNNHHIVDDILWDQNPTCTFETRNGPVTYMEYFKTKHGIEIRNKSQPLLLNKKVRKVGNTGQEEVSLICLIPELCNITGISQDMKTRQFLKDMAEHTRLPPAKRFDVLRKYIQNVKRSPEAQKILNDWGLSIADGVIDLNARILGNNEIRLRNRKIDLSRVPDWGNSCSKDNLINPIDMNSWVVLCTQRDITTVEKFIARLRNLANGFGCVITAPVYVNVGKGTDVNYHDALNKHANDNVQIALIVVPAARDSLYSVIKNTTLSRKGVLSQVVRLQTLQRENILTGVTLKIGLQMQAKLGGSLWSVVFPPTCNDFMFVGIDTFHSKSLKKSVGAIVCSFDERHTRFYTGLAFQAHEIADALKTHLQKAMEVRRQATGKFPSTIFLTRDGVGDGQLEQVKNYEMAEYIKAAKELGANTRFCFTVIQKRNNMRMVTQQLQNPPAGTVLDHTITRKNYEDFYLVPQATRIGTVSPMHYVVLHNDSPDLNLERIQKLCFKLCHLYYNWSGAVSVPAPCQYAHKAAYLIGEHMERKPLDCLNDKLYYL